MKWTIRAVLWTAVGDALVLLGVSLAGFATHQSNPAGGRLLAMVIPLLAAWGLTAFLGGLYQPGWVTWKGALCWPVWPRDPWPPFCAVYGWGARRWCRCLRWCFRAQRRWEWAYGEFWRCGCSKQRHAHERG